MRHALIALSMLLGAMNPAAGQVSVGISVPGVSIGFHQPVYPQLVLVPGYPVYYAPRVNANYFFYDGMYWVYHGDHWYASTWYNGPWELVDPYHVPLFVLRVPVRYYRAPPVYFRAWYVDAAPRWDHHWGPRWARERRGWNHWNRGAAPRPAPLPVYQQRYSGNRYPRAEEQHTLRSQQYHYRPRETVVQQRFQSRSTQQEPTSFRPDPQGGPAGQERRQPPRHEPDQRVQQVPKPPPQAHQRGPQDKGEPQQSRGNAERRQGPKPDRGKDRHYGQERQ